MVRISYEHPARRPRTNEYAWSSCMMFPVHKRCVKMNSPIIIIMNAWQLEYPTAAWFLAAQPYLNLGIELSNDLVAQLVGAWQAICQVAVPPRHYLFFPTFFHVSHAPSPPNMPVWYSLQLYPWQFSLKYSKWGLKCSPESFTPLPPTSNAVFVNSKYFYLCVTLEHKHLAHFYSLHCVWANKSTKNCLSRHLMSVCLIWITCVQWFMDLWGSGHVQV